MPRVEAIADKAEVSAEHHGVVDSVIEVFGGIRGPHSILLYSPPLEAIVIELSRYFRGNSIVKPPERELAAITAAREKDSFYVWAAQVANARRAGIAEETIAAIREERDPKILPPAEAAIVTYVQQLMRHNRVDQPSFDALKDQYGVPWLVELTAMAGYFGMLAGVVNAFEVPTPPDGESLPVKD
jgi:4-carboxymuconolactone decarboxylase